MSTKFWSEKGHLIYKNAYYQKKRNIISRPKSKRTKTIRTYHNLGVCQSLIQGWEQHCHDFAEVLTIATIKVSHILGLMCWCEISRTLHTHIQSYTYIRTRIHVHTSAYSVKTVKKNNMHHILHYLSFLSCPQRCPHPHTHVSDTFTYIYIYICIYVYIFIYSYLFVMCRKLINICQVGMAYTCMTTRGALSLRHLKLDHETGVVH